MGKVLALETWHEFDDACRGPSRWGATSDTEVWTQRAAIALPDELMSDCEAPDLVTYFFGPCFAAIACCFFWLAALFLSCFCFACF